MSKDEFLAFPDQLYVGVENRKDFSTKDFPLAFATPFGKDAAFKKRQETVDRWIGDGYEHGWITKDANGNDISPSNKWISTKVKVGDHLPEVIDNKPLEGFKFEGSVSRWSTSNKWFEINDPRGFTLQISASNLADIILNCSISNGILQGFFVWGRAGAVNYLTRMNHPDYMQHVLAKHKVLEPGKKIYTKSLGEAVYLGTAYKFQFDVIRKYNPPSWIGGPTRPDSERYSYNFKISKKQVNVFHRTRIEDEDEFITRNELPKNFRLVGKVDKIPEIPYDVDMLDEENILTFYRLFKTKMDLDNYNCSIDDCKIIFKNLYETKYPHYPSSKSWYF